MIDWKNSLAQLKREYKLKVSLDYSSGSYILPLDSHNWIDELIDSEDPTEFSLTIVKMSDEELEGLEEFTGW